MEHLHFNTCTVPDSTTFLPSRCNMSAESVPFFVKKLLKHSHRVGVSEKSLRVVEQIFLTLSKRTHNSVYEFPHHEENIPCTPHPVVHSGDFGRVGVWTFQCRL